jgi:hypothetical protein
LGVSESIWGGHLATEDKFIVCDFCREGRLTSSLKELKLRQLSKKGYVHFSAVVTVRVCDFCGAKSFEAGAEQILNEAFEREYHKLP